MSGGGQDCQLALPHLVGLCPILEIMMKLRLAPDIREVKTEKQREIDSSFHSETWPRVRRRGYRTRPPVPSAANRESERFRERKR